MLLLAVNNIMAQHQEQPQDGTSKPRPNGTFISRDTRLPAFGCPLFSPPFFLTRPFNALLLLMAPTLLYLQEEVLYLPMKIFCAEKIKTVCMHLAVSAFVVSLSLTEQSMPTV